VFAWLINLTGYSQFLLPLLIRRTCTIRRWLYLRLIVWAGSAPSAGLASAVGIFIVCAGFAAAFAIAAGVVVACAEFVRSED
jgi:hypothetical protein